MFIRRKEYRELKGSVAKIYADYYFRGCPNWSSSLIKELKSDIDWLKNPNGQINVIKYNNTDEYTYVFLYQNTHCSIDDIRGHSEGIEIDEYLFDSNSMILTLKDNTENTYSYIISRDSCYPKRINLKLDSDSNNWIKIDKTKFS